MSGTSLLLLSREEESMLVGAFDAEAGGIGTWDGCS